MSSAGHYIRDSDIHMCYDPINCYICKKAAEAAVMEISARADEVLRVEEEKKDGKKYDDQKEPVARGLFDYFPRALLAVADISRYGAQKYAVPYSDKNWERVDDARGRYRDAIGRHILGEATDGLVDKESHLLHAAHAAWNALAYLELLLR